MIPSDQQQAIYDFTRDGTGHGVVVARAGSGKTTSIIGALEHVRPGANVLCCAFNARIRDTLKERVPPGVTVRTLHQLGRDTLAAYSDFRRFKHDEKYEKDREMAVLALKDSRFSTFVEPEDKEIYADLVDRIMRGSSLVKATLTKERPALVKLVEEFQLATSGCAPDEMAEYISRAVKAAVADWPRTTFDDEVWFPVLYGLGLGNFDFVFCDEVQDVSLVQLRLVQSALAPQGRIICVGDDRQGIYRWRGADTNTVERVKQELNATVLALSTSYRCPTSVIKHVQPIVPDIEAATDAPKGIVKHLELGEMLTMVKPHDFVLSRLNAPLAQIGLDLSMNKVPAKIIGAQDIARSLTSLVRRSRKKTIEAFKTWLHDFQTSEEKRLAGNTQALTYLFDRIDTLESFLEGAEDTADVLDRINTYFARENERNNGRAVILATVHKLKGDEAPRVFLLEETFFLKRGDPREEENAYYVACTRAQRELYLVTGLYSKKKRKES